MLQALPAGLDVLARRPGVGLPLLLASIFAPCGGCGLKFASPDARSTAGRDAANDQSASLVRLRDAAAVDDHSRASGVEADSISGQNVVNLVVQTVEKSPRAALGVLLGLAGAFIVACGLVAAFWWLARRSSRDLGVVIRAIESSGADVKQKVALERSRLTALHRRVQRETRKAVQA